MSDFDPEDMKSGSLAVYLANDTEDRGDRASGLGKYLTDQPGANSE